MATRIPKWIKKYSEDDTAVVPLERLGIRKDEKKFRSAVGEDTESPWSRAYPMNMTQFYSASVCQIIFKASRLQI